MYAQLIERNVALHRVDELCRVVRRELLTALRGQPGFSGALSLVDRETGRSLLVVLWETDEEAARPLVQCDGPIREALAAIEGLTGADCCSSSVWEVSRRG
jgi:hypothetical protein